MTKWRVLTFANGFPSPPIRLIASKSQGRVLDETDLTVVIGTFAHD